MEGKTDLSDEGDWWLIESLLLRVSDVGRHDLGEWQRRRGTRVFQCLAEFLSFDRQLTADGVLDVENGGVEIVDGEHCGRRKSTEMVVDRSLQSMATGKKYLADHLFYVA